MPTEAVLVLLGVVALFLAFGTGLYYADRQTRQFREK